MVVGDTLVQAQRAFAKAKLLTRASATSLVVNASIRPETVVAQRGAHLTVAVPSGKPCTRTQLAVTYRFNQGGMGNLFAGLLVRNISHAWCAIAGPFRLAGYSSAGAQVTDTETVTLSDPTIDVLSPDTPLAPRTPSFTGSGVGDDYPVNVFWAYVGFGGPSDVCAPANPTSQNRPITPSTWRLTFPSGFTLSAPNGTAAKARKARTTQHAESATPFSSCGGTIDMSLGATVR